MTTLQTNIPDQLFHQAQFLVQQVGMSNLDDLVTEAMRRYLESHREAMSERFIKDDVAWGLHGRD